MNKTHFATLNIGTAVSSACGRKGRTSDVPSRVTCLTCQSKPAFVEADNAARIAKMDAFWAQTPREFREPWSSDQSIIVCKVDGGTLFRDAGRSCMGHYQDYKCASCGTVASRLTETGMSF